MNTTPPGAARNQDLWLSLVDSERRFVQARMKFLAECTAKVEVLRAAINSGDGSTALRLAFFLPETERVQLFDELLAHAAVGHADVGLCRQLIQSLPRDWVLSNIEEQAERYLAEGEHEEYRRLLELYFTLDRSLTLRLAHRAAGHTNPDVREAGQDFLERLQEESAAGEPRAYPQ